MSRFILRDEYFGSTIYDRNTLTFRFLDEEDTSALKKGKPIENDFVSDPNEIEVLERDVENAPKGMLYAPVRLYFEVTRQCNLHCKNCCSSSGKGASGDMSLENVLNTLDGLRKDGVMEIRVTGGEPTQRPNWREILKHAKGLGFVLSLNSNGVYEDSSVIDDLAEISPEQIIFSIDGLRDSHETMRGKGTYDRTLASLSKLHARGANLRVNTILNRCTIHEIPELVELASNYSAEMCFILLRPMGRAIDLRDELLSIGQLNEAVGTVKQLRNIYPGTKIMTSYDVISQNAIRPANDLDLTSCAAGLRGCNIMNDGNIYACHFLAELDNEFKLGNIIEEHFSILDIWRHSQQLLDFRKRSLEKTRECRSCADYETNCFGSCIVMEKYSEKNLTGKDPYCFHDL